MLLDAEGTFSEDQAITVDAASTNYIDLKNTINRVGDPLDIVIAVSESFATGSSVNFKLQSDDNSSFSSPKDEVITGGVTTANLAAGTQLSLVVPRSTQRYLRMYYDVSGTFTAGKVTVGFVKDLSTMDADVIAELAALT